MIRDFLLFAKKNKTLGPFYEQVKNRYISFADRGHSRLNVLQAFPLYRPYSGGSYRLREPLALQSINDMVPALKAFGDCLGHRHLPAVTDHDYAQKNGAGHAEELAELFRRYGSDKATRHGYFRVYASILGQLGEQEQINLLEIGLGTNNTDVVSHMGIAGKPGASLRAFRDFLPNGHVFGADVDRRILFSEERIDTSYVDQTDRSALASLGQRLPAELHLMIDDGLHLPTANLNSLAFFLSKLAVGGFAVVEDIPRLALDLWQFVAGILPDRYESCIVESGPSLMFVVKRLN